MEVDVEFEAVVRPRAELHLADLDVEREVANVDGAGGAEDRRRNPRHAAVRADDGHGVAVLLQPRVGAVQWMIRATARQRLYTYSEKTSQNLWPRHDRHFVGITWHNVLSYSQIPLHGHGHGPERTRTDTTEFRRKKSPCPCPCRARVGPVSVSV